MSKPATISIRAQGVFDEMSHRQRTTTTSEQAPVFSQYAALMSAMVLHARATERESRPPCNGLKLAMDVTSKLVTPVSVATMAPASLSELLGGPFSRYITIFASTPVLGVLLLDCNATVREVHLEFQQMTESSSVVLWPSQIHQRYILKHGLEKVVDLWSPWPPHRSLSLQDWDTRGIEQIHYSWSLFVVHLEWCLFLRTKFFQATSN